MLTLGALSFAAPWLLAAAAALPILWWLLRLTPPSPKKLAFPAIRLLFNLKPKEETPHHTPWWLILLRLVIAGLVITGLAQPLWNADEAFTQPGPVLIAIDDGWASAHHWDERIAAAQKLIDKAERNERHVILLSTSMFASERPPNLQPLAAVTASAQISALQPKPWPTDRAALAELLEKTELPVDLNVTWITDGIADIRTGADARLNDALSALGTMSVMSPGVDLPLLMLTPERSADGLYARVARARAGFPQSVSLRVLDRNGRTLGLAQGRFDTSATTLKVKVELPLELANRVSRIVLEGAATAGAAALIDDGSGRKPIGLVTDNAAFSRQPMLGELYFVERAIQPRHEARIDRLASLLHQDVSIILLTDQVVLSAEDRQALKNWIDQGGMLIRFAGERLSAEPADDLLPVKLRKGDRILGGALSWTEPASLSAFPANSPFAGLQIPEDVQISRQVLAEPDIDLGGKTWARLSDGTPLVTGARMGKGFSVLFHIGSNADWSNLPISGLFVEMLNRLVQTAEGISAQSAPDRPLAPVQTLDGFGRLNTAPVTALAIGPKEFTKGQVGPDHPPGFYGPEDQRRALNLAPSQPRFVPLSLPATPLQVDRTLDLAPIVFIIAFLLLILDLLITLMMRGLLRLRRGAVTAGTTAVVLFLCLAMGNRAEAQALQDPPLKDQDVIYATETTHLAYVRTGAPQVDATSRAGLFGLTEILLQRTSTDVGEPVGVDLEADELSFYPVLYWPVTAVQRTPSPDAIAKLNRYLAAGGLIFFDTADQNLVGFSGGDMGPGVQRLRELTAGLDIPPLIPIPADHVLTRSFYLLRDFPGRWIGGTVWVEAAQSRINDGVSGIIVGSNDYAAAWATDDVGQPMFPTTPGGERQREFAYRFGVNLAMYALTGNYKSDQVHVPAILERLGQ